jgi:hypothetical protein
MGLIGGMARTAVVAGTATAVSNRVSRRQANRWAEPEPAPQQTYYAPPAPVAAPQDAGDDIYEQLQKLGELKAAGMLTVEEFTAQKARVLAQ